MSARIEWASARYIEIEKASLPGEIEHNGDSNAAPAIALACYGGSENSNTLVIEGPIADLHSLLERIKAAIFDIDMAIANDRAAAGA